MTPLEFAELETFSSFLKILAPRGVKVCVRSLRLGFGSEWLVQMASRMRSAGALDAEGALLLRKLCARRGDDGGFFESVLAHFEFLRLNPAACGLLLATNDCFFDSSSFSWDDADTREKVNAFMECVRTGGLAGLTPEEVLASGAADLATLRGVAEAFRAFALVEPAQRARVIKTARREGVSAMDVLAGGGGNSPPVPKKQRVVAIRTPSAKRTKAKTFEEKLAALACPLCQANAPCEVEMCTTSRALFQETVRTVYFACCVSHGHVCKKCSVSLAQKRSKDKIKRVLFKSGEFAWHVSLEWAMFSFVDEDTGETHVVDGTGTRVVCASLECTRAKRINSAAVKLFVVEDEWGTTLRAHLRLGTSNVWRVDPLRVVLMREAVVKEMTNRLFYVDVGGRRVHCDATAKLFALCDRGDSLLPFPAEFALPLKTKSSSVAVKVICDAAFSSLDMTDAAVKAHRAARASLGTSRVIRSTHLTVGIASRETQYAIDGYGYD
jgi:hypothetical protein